MNNILILDTETTDLEQKRLVQLAYKKPKSNKIFNKLYKAPIAITPGASSMSHITNEDVADKPTFAGSEDAQKLQELLNDHILVAHNARFDIDVLKNEGIETKFHICTQKIAQRLIKDESIERHSLQYLRYYLGLYRQEKERYIAHDARGDICILENLFLYLFDLIQRNVVGDSSCCGVRIVNISDKEAAAGGVKGWSYCGKCKMPQGLEEKDVLVRMMNIQNEPLILPKINFGKHAGMSFEELAAKHLDYIQWLIGKINANNERDKDPDLTYTCEYYLKKGR